MNAIALITATLFTLNGAANTVKINAQQTKSARIAQAQRELDTADTLYHNSTRQLAYANKVLDAVSNNSVEVGSMWFRSFRSGGVTEKYLALSVQIEELGHFAKRERLYDIHDVSHKLASRYSEMAQLASLGGKEAVADGTGVYTEKMALHIAEANTVLFELRKKFKEENELALAKLKEKTLAVDRLLYPQ